MSLYFIICSCLLGKCSAYNNTFCPSKPGSPFVPFTPSSPLGPATPLIPEPPEVPLSPFEPFWPLDPFKPGCPFGPRGPVFPPKPNMPVAPSVPEIIIHCTKLSKWSDDHIRFCTFRISRSRRRPRSFFSVHHLLKQLMDFDQTCIYTLLGGRNELIIFW